MQTGYLAAVDEFTQAVVVVPAHNERQHLPRCLRAMVTAAMCVPMPVLVVVVLDATDDDSGELVGRYGQDVHFVTVDAGNVGAARAAGFSYSRTSCHQDVSRIWYATTDADSVVPADWLLRMTQADADMVLGVVRVPVWRHLSAAAARRYLRGYAGGAATGSGGAGAEAAGHRHIHGANMGFRADAYWRLGGFRPLVAGEDVELVARFEGQGLQIAWDAGLSVDTSDRLRGRAPNGFAAHLRALIKDRA